MDRVASNIRRLFREKRLSRGDISKRLGTGTSYVSQLISSNLTLSSLEKLAEAFECDISEFFVDTSVKPKKIVEEQKEEPQIYGFIKMYDKIVEIKSLQDLKDAVLKCEINQL